MSLAIMSPLEACEPRNKCAVKLLGLDNSELTDEEILECISLYIEPSKIEALLFDSFNKFYVLFLVDIESTCRLVGKRLEFRSHTINIYPLLDCYVIQNVYPCLTAESLSDIFRTFGNVFTVSNHHAVPNSSKFSHVLSGKREITFLLPGKEIEIFIPTSVVHPPYSFHVKKFCCACLTEGHSMLYCPDVEEDDTMQKIKFDDLDGDDEVDALIKSELFEDTKVDDSSDIQLATVEGSSKEKENDEPPQEISGSNIVNIEKEGAAKEIEVDNTSEANSKRLKISNEEVSTTTGLYPGFRSTESGLYSTML